MTDKVTLITCTGTRQEAFSQCENYMERQTVWKDIDCQWIVCDDGPIPTECRLKLTQTYIRGPKIWQPRFNMQRLNMMAALEKVEGDYIFIIEDDDAYKPTYLEVMLKLLKQFPIVGEGGANYYHIANRMYKEHRNFKHASLCQTGLIAAALPILDQAVNSGEIYFDVVLWKLAHENGYKPLLFLGQNLVTGIKGMPGRGNIGVGGLPKDYIKDPDFSKLKELVGDRDANFYINLTKNKELWKDKML